MSTNDFVDDDGHTLADITPATIDENDDPDTAVNGEADDTGEHLDWDRAKGGPMADHATDEEPECQFGDDAEKGE